MDATAVDSHRRLAPVRRDDVEHLLLIGGPTDVVVESDIRIGHHRRITSAKRAGAGAARTARSRPATGAGTCARRATPNERQSRLVPAVAGRRSQTGGGCAGAGASTARARILSASPGRNCSALPATSIRRFRAQRRAPTPRCPAAPVLKGPAPTPPSDHLDDALLKELEVSLDDSDAVPHKVPTPSLDDEMAKLLG